MAMKSIRIFDLIDRLCGVIYSDNRLLTAEHGLQPVHLDVLRYLSRCNRYSNTPAAITKYLMSTKGTVSQSIKLLQRDALISKLADADDRRIVRLKLLKKGKRLLQKLDDKAALRRAVDILDGGNQQLIEGALTELLRSAQRINQNRTFGQCKTCRFFRRPSESRFQCGLTKESLSKADTELICVEHEFADSAA